jgi:hypothetical protein
VNEYPTALGIDLDLTPGAKANKHSGDSGRGNQHGG